MSQANRLCISVIPSSRQSARGLFNVQLYLDAPCGKLDPNCGLRLQAKFVTGEATEQIGLANARISYQDYLEEIIVTAAEL